MSSTDTCVVRPELIEFEKAEESLFLSMVAHPSTGFKFTNKAVTSADVADVNTMTFAASELADLGARQLFVSNIETNADTTLRISTVTQLDMATGGTGEINVNAGNVINVENMSLTGVTGTIDLNGGTMVMGGGTIDMAGGNIINVTDLKVSEIRLHDTNKIDNLNGNTLVLEGATFQDATEVHIHSTNKIDNLTTGSIILEGVTFQNQDMTTVNNITFNDNATSSINCPASGDMSIVSDGSLTLKADTTINLANSTDGTTAVRVTNVATPINDDDAANKGYVNVAVAQNVQGLKPKKATDCSLFGGRHIGEANGAISSDFDFATATNVFGSFTKYTIEFTPTAPVDGVDSSELKFHLQGTAGDITFDGVIFTQTDLDLITNSGASDGTTGPELFKKRVLIMNLNETSINNSAAYDGTTTFTGALAHNNANLKGLNGIWEISSLAPSGTAGWKTLTMKRARDMNENDEVLNGAYVYVKGGSRGNYGYVVTSNDPLKIGAAGGGQGLTVDGTDTLKELEWIEFNNIDYELAFVNQEGKQKEILPDVNATFRQGGIVMKYEATDEKQVMVNAEYLRYEADSNATGGLALQINGNVDFNLVAADAHINSNSDAEKVVVNGTQFERQGTVYNINTTNVVANTVTCESDRSLKKNIKPMMNGLDLVSKLNAVTYNWKTDEVADKEEYGFIAQEVEENFPTLVKTNSETGVKSVDYQKMVSILALAVQELAAKLN